MTNVDQKVPEALMWGERGLVATLFQDLGTGNTFERWTQFLRLIDLPIPRLTQVRTIIEPDFGQFGKPDAITLLVGENGRYILITEAKRAPYIPSARHRSERALPGFNSSINGQLELNHRLALALSDFLPEMGPPLVEPDWILETPYLVPRIGTTRRLWNPVVLGQVVEQLGLFGLAPDHYCHLFITTDRSDPRTASIPEYLQPILLAAPAVPVPFEAPQFLWTNWSQIQDLLARAVDDGPCPSRFLSTYALNHLNLQLPRTRQHVPAAWGGIGVALVRLRQQLDGLPVNPASYVHLSWRLGSAKLRDYSPNGVLVGPSRPLNEVASLIVGEPIDYAERPPVADVGWWSREIARLNGTQPPP